MFCFIEAACLRFVSCYTDKKKFLIYKEIQMGSGAKSYIRKGFHLFSPYMRRSLVIYDFAPVPSDFPNI